MDDDIEYALRIQANDNGIFDEEVIQDIIEAYKSNNHKLLDDLLNQDDNDFPDLEPTNDQDLDPDQIFGSFRIPTRLHQSLLYSITSSNRLNNPLLQIGPNHNSLQQINLNEILDIGNNSQHFNQISRELFRMQLPEYNEEDYNNENIDHNYAGVSFSNGPGGFLSIASNGFYSRNGIDYTNGDITINGIANQINQFLGAIGNVTNQFIDVPVTLTDNALDKIKDLTYKELKERNPKIDSDEKCAICMALLSEDNDNFKYNCLPCNHSYHTECIKQYLKDYDYHCPICKKECGDHVAKI